MAFQPLGYGFEIRSRAAPAAVKSAIRSAATGWFDTKNGARGWIVGPFMCLWFSAFDRYGPMVLARISRDGRGTRISGRAGSDLNGMILLVLIGPFLVPMMVELIASGAVSGWRAVLLGGVAVMIPVSLWWAHKDRGEAQPLVRFLTKVVPEQGAGEPSARRAARVAKNLTLSLSGDDLHTPVTIDAIEATLLRVGAGGFLVLAAAPEAYIQTASHDGGEFIIERRDGDYTRHFTASRPGFARKSRRGGDTFTFDETLDVLAAYATDTSMPGWVFWKPASIGSPTEPRWASAKR